MRIRIYLCCFFFFKKREKLGIFFLNLEFPTAHGQSQELVEETFLLLVAAVGHMTSEDCVQRSAVPGLKQSNDRQQALVEGRHVLSRVLGLIQILFQEETAAET